MSRRPEPAAARRDHGFTFVEMTVVLIIVALGTALAVPMIEGGFEGREVRRATRQIASTMHFCRGEAVALGVPQEMVIDTLENRYYTTDWGRWAILTDRARIEDVRAGAVSGDHVAHIFFFPNGSTSGAEVVIAGRDNRNDHRLRIHLDPLLGTVRVEDAAA